MGVISSLVLDLVSQAERPLKIAEIHRAAELALLAPISASTIKDALSRMAADPASPVKRVAPGMYGNR